MASFIYLEGVGSALVGEYVYGVSERSTPVHLSRVWLRIHLMMAISSQTRGGQPSNAQYPVLLEMFSLKQSGKWAGNRWVAGRFIKVTFLSFRVQTEAFSPEHLSVLTGGFWPLYLLISVWKA